MSLRLRIAVIVAVVVAVVVTTRAVLQVQVLERRLDDTARVAIRDTAARLARQLSEGVWPSPRDLHAILEDAAEDPAVWRVTLLPVASASPLPQPITSGARVHPEERTLADEVARSGAAQGGLARGDLALAAAPVFRDGRPAAVVVASASLAPTRALLAEDRRLSLWFAVAAFAAITLGLTWLGRRLIERPLQHILGVMRRAGEGTLDARLRFRRRDDIGELAHALDDMLERMQRLDAAQRERIDVATEELRKRNDDLVASYQRMFALREALARAEQNAAAGQTAANLAHQVGTPLNLISGYVQMMLQESDVDPRQVERLRTVQEQIKKVTGYIRATLEHVRLPTSQREPVVLAPLLRRIVDVSRPRLQASGIEVELDVADELPWLLGEPVRLELALLNLVKNSLDAMPDGGRMRISAHAERDGSRLEFADTGPGIPDAVLPRIFEPWVTTKPVGQGTGLGLAFTREVILAHGGAIEVRTAPGEGATFIIHLPGKSGGAPPTREV